MCVCVYECVSVCIQGALVAYQGCVCVQGVLVAYQEQPPGQLATIENNFKHYQMSSTKGATAPCGELLPTDIVEWRQINSPILPVFQA